MPRAKSQTLFINLSVAKVRRRLKEQRIGVKKVSSAGRNQAMVVHTATGEHLRELEAVFGDTVTSSRQQELDTPVESLKNLGPTTADWLHQVGVHTRADLERVGAASTFRLLLDREATASLNLLWALHGALHEIDWREVSEQEKAKLRAAVAELG